MPFIGSGHLWMVLILLAVVLIFKGPGKLPEMGAGIGRAIREFHGAMRNDATSTPIDDKPADKAAH